MEVHVWLLKPMVDEEGTGRSDQIGLLQVIEQNSWKNIRKGYGNVLPCMISGHWCGWRCSWGWTWVDGDHYTTEKDWDTFGRPVRTGA